VFKNRVQKQIFGPKTEEIRGNWRKLRNKELSDLNCSPNIIAIIRSRKMGWADMWHGWKRRELFTGFWWGNLKEGDHFEEEERLILKWALNMK
jgi:hypothetical protein